MKRLLASACASTLPLLPACIGGTGAGDAVRDSLRELARAITDARASLPGFVTAVTSDIRNGRIYLTGRSNALTRRGGR